MDPQLLPISVVIPVYNRPQTVCRAIDCALSQTQPPAEIIVVDDGSTDNTAKAVKAYGDAVRYHFQHNAGPSAARNKGIELASQEWIAFLDSDDEWLPTKLQKQWDLVNRLENMVWCVSAYSMRDMQTGEQYPRFRPEQLRGSARPRENCLNLFEAMNQVDEFAMDAYLIKRAVLLEAGLFRTDLRYGEDTELIWRIACTTPLIAYVEESLTIYNQTDDGLTRLSSPEVVVNSIIAAYKPFLTCTDIEGRPVPILPYVRRKVRKWLYILFTMERWDLLEGLTQAYQAQLPFWHRWVLSRVCCLPRKVRQKIGRRILRGLRFH